MRQDPQPVAGLESPSPDASVSAHDAPPQLDVLPLLKAYRSALHLADCPPPSLQLPDPLERLHRCCDRRLAVTTSLRGMCAVAQMSLSGR